MAEWAPILLSILAAVWTFHRLPHWWLAFPAAILSWLVANWVVAALWALIRRLIELAEGIH